MMKYAYRALIAVVCFALFVYVVPLFASVLGLPLGGALWQLIQILVAIIAVGYVIFGTYP